MDKQSPRQRNHRLVTHNVPLTWQGPGDVHDTMERDIWRELGKAIIDVDEQLAELAGWHSTEVSRLIRKVNRLREMADKAYEWHAGRPVPTKEAS
jgi:hypothetical protein